MLVYQRYLGQKSGFITSSLRSCLYGYLAIEVPDAPIRPVVHSICSRAGCALLHLRSSLYINHILSVRLQVPSSSFSWPSGLSRFTVLYNNKPAQRGADVTPIYLRAVIVGLA